MVAAFVLLALAVGCEPPLAPTDADGDGVPARLDCDDGDASVHPGAAETCDGRDEDCDGEVDEHGGREQPRWYRDEDGDGFGARGDPVWACVGPLGRVDNPDDCHDRGPLADRTYPGAAWAESATACMQDADGDGWGAVDPLGDGISPGADCDDRSIAAAATYPGAAEVESAARCLQDADLDGWGSAHPISGLAEPGLDCDDRNWWIAPDRRELCNGQDDNCNGVIDDPFLGPWYVDADGDGWGDAATEWYGCPASQGVVTASGDCDDTDDQRYPGAPEWPCDGKDNDCDGVGDEDCDALDLAAVGLAWTGGTDGVAAGRAVAGVGDVDGDGFDDVLVGAPYSSLGAPGGGAAFLVLGEAMPTAGSLHTADAVFAGARRSAEAGFAVSNAGDVDGDGLADLLIGVSHRWGIGRESGAACLFLGQASPVDRDMGHADACFGGESPLDHAGRSVAGAGDFDGDGFGDSWIGAAGNDARGRRAGAAYLVLGEPSPTNQLLSGVDAQLYGEQPGDMAGWAVAGLGDVDGDGLDDGLIGAPWAYTGDGCVYLLLGSTTHTSMSLTTASARFSGETLSNAGYALAAAGDVDGDGLPDMLVGAPSEVSSTTGPGAVYVVLGSASPRDLSLAAAAVRIAGVSAWDRVGSSVAGMGDVHGDGFDDLLVGSPGDDSSGEQAGSVWFFAGGPDLFGVSAVTGGTWLLGAAAGDRAGISVAGVGDFDGDGVPDALVGAPGADIAADGAGAAYLVLGSTLW